MYILVGIYQVMAGELLVKIFFLHNPLIELTRVLEGRLVLIYTR